MVVGVLILVGRVGLTTIVLVGASMGVFNVFIIVIKALGVVTRGTSATGIARVDACGWLRAVRRLRDARARHAEGGTTQQTGN